MCESFSIWRIGTTETAIIELPESVGLPSQCFGYQNLLMGERHEGFYLLFYGMDLLTDLKKLKSFWSMCWCPIFNFLFIYRNITCIKKFY